MSLVVYNLGANAMPKLVKKTWVKPQVRVVDPIPLVLEERFALIKANLRGADLVLGCPKK